MYLASVCRTSNIRFPRFDVEPCWRMRPFVNRNIEKIRSDFLGFQQNSIEDPFFFYNWNKLLYIIKKNECSCPFYQRKMSIRSNFFVFCFCFFIVAITVDYRRDSRDNANVFPFCSSGARRPFRQVRWTALFWCVPSPAMTGSSGFAGTTPLSALYCSIEEGETTDPGVTV